MPRRDSFMVDENTATWRRCFVSCTGCECQNAYLPSGDTCVSLSAQHGATLSRRPAKSREQRRLSTAIALGINVRTYRSANCTLDNWRPCVLCDRSSGVEHLDTVRAVLWVTQFFDVAWRLNCSHAPSQIDYMSVYSVASWLSLQPWSRLGYNVVMTFRFNNDNNNNGAKPNFRAPVAGKSSPAGTCFVQHSNPAYSLFATATTANVRNVNAINKDQLPCFGFWTVSLILF